MGKEKREEFSNGFVFMIAMANRVEPVGALFVAKLAVDGVRLSARRVNARGKRIRAPSGSPEDVPLEFQMLPGILRCRPGSGILLRGGGRRGSSPVSKV